MSSSNSNAAARRRRAGPPPMQNIMRPSPNGLVNANVRAMPGQQQRPPMPQRQMLPPMPQQQVPQQQRPPMPQRQMPPQHIHPERQPMPYPQQNQPQPKPVMTPAQMLISHEKRITEFERVIPDIIGKLDNSERIQQNAPVQAEQSVSFEVVKQLEAKIKELETRIFSVTSSYKSLHEFATNTNSALMNLINNPPVCECNHRHSLPTEDENVDVAFTSRVAGDDDITHFAEENTTMLEDEECGIELEIQPTFGDEFIGESNDQDDDNDQYYDDGNQNDLELQDAEQDADEN